MKVVMTSARLIMGSLIALALMAGQPLAGQASDSTALGTDRSHVQATQTACAPGTVSASAVSRDLAIVQLRLRALGVTNAQVPKSSGTCVVVSAPLTVKKTGVLIGVLQSGIVAIADGGTRALNNGARVILVCATASCEPGVSKGKTNLNARPPTLRIVVSSRDVRKAAHSSMSTAPVSLLWCTALKRRGPEPGARTRRHTSANTRPLWPTTLS
jgi:hypothetical protein